MCDLSAKPPPPPLSLPPPFNQFLSVSVFEVTVPPLLHGFLYSSFFWSPHLSLEVFSQPSSSSRLSPEASMMSERRCSLEDDCSSLLSRLGSDSPRPRMKYGGMFCSVEGAFENKTLNFESFSPQTQRRRVVRTRSDSHDGRDAARGTGQTVVFPTGHAQEKHYGKREVHIYLKFILNICLWMMIDVFGYLIDFNPEPEIWSPQNCTGPIKKMT